MIKGLIFDLDGTLLDSTPAWKHVGTDYLDKNNIEYQSDIDKLLQEMSLQQAAEYFSNVMGVKHNPETIIEHICDMVGDKYRFTVPLKNGVLEFLEGMKQKGIKMCIATATDKTLAAAALKRVGAYDYFDFILTCSDVGSGKDEPFIFIECAKKMGLEISETVIYEDSLYAIKTAKRAGFKVVGIYDEASIEETDEIKTICDEYKECWA